MTPKEAAKTILVGMTLILALTTATIAWGAFRKVITTVSVEGGWVAIAVTVAALAFIPVVLKVMKEHPAK